MVKRGAASQANQDGGEIDLTPMLDVVFIMLIFFIRTFDPKHFWSMPKNWFIFEHIKCSSKITIMNF